MKPACRFLLVICFWVVLSGCASLGFGSRIILLEEAAVLTTRGQLVRGVVTGNASRAALTTLTEVNAVTRTITPATLARIRATVTAEEMALIEGTVANRTAFNRLFQRVWLDRTKANALYIRNASGEKLPFAQVVDHDLIQLHTNQRYYKLPGSVFQVKGTSKIRVRTEASESANIYTHIDPGKPVLVLDRLSNGWSKVMIGEETSLFILSALLAPCLFDSDSTVKEHPGLKIISPDERAEFDYPRTTIVTWTGIPEASSYILEVQLSHAPYDYNAAYYSHLPYSPYGIYTTTQTSATYHGMGMQVHRFRVIAKSNDGFIATTPWRYVNYIN